MISLLEAFVYSLTGLSALYSIAVYNQVTDYGLSPRNKRHIGILGLMVLGSILAWQTI